MKHDRVDIVTRQTEMLLKNTEATLDAITREQCDATAVRWPLWKHLYHLAPFT